MVLTNSPMSTSPSKRMGNTRNHHIFLRFFVIMIDRVFIPIRNKFVFIQSHTIQNRKFKFIIKSFTFTVAAQNRCRKLGFGLSYAVTSKMKMIDKEHGGIKFLNAPNPNFDCFFNIMAAIFDSFGQFFFR